MGVALELIVIPVVLLIALVVAAVWANLSVGAVFLGVLVVAMLIGAVVLLLRLEWRIEEEAGLDETKDPSLDLHPRPTPASPAREAAQDEASRHPPL